MAYTEISGMGFWYMSTSSALVPGIIFICTEPGSADEGYIWDGSDWVDPTTITDYDDAGIMQTMTQYHATLFQGRRYYLDMATLGGSPGQVEAVVVNSANGAYHGVMGPFNVRSNTLQREAGYDPRTDEVVSGLTYQEQAAGVAAFAGGTVTPELNTPSSGLTRHQYKLGGTTYLTVTTEDATKGKRTVGTFPSI
jgi:hypothetical protein